MKTLFTQSWMAQGFTSWRSVTLLWVIVLSGSAFAQPATSTTPVELRRQAVSTTAPRTVPTDETRDPIFEPLYRNFYNTYRLGPGDELAIRVKGQPDYTVDRAKVSPVGRVYHPLLGDVEVVGQTIEQIHKHFSTELAEYLLEPKVSVELIEAHSAKVGVLGEVKAPGIVVITRPLTVLDAIMASGGFADTGNKSNVTLLRPVGGRMTETKVNIKRLLDGKAALEENPTLRAGDTVVVRSNFRKKLNDITALTGFASFIAFIAR